MLLIPALILALVYIGLFVGLALTRLSYPFELEWMEGGSLQHLSRLLAGEPLYPPPGLEFVPFPYPPLYYHAAALFTPLFGAGFLALRTLSLLSALGVHLLIYYMVKRETGRWQLGVISAGIFAATYRASGAYFDIARIDSFFLLLALASVCLLRFRRDRPGLMLAALFAFLAVMTKQTGLALLGPSLLWCAFVDWGSHGWQLTRWRRLIFFGLPSLLSVALATWWLEVSSGGQFLFYILGAQQGHDIRFHMIPYFFGMDLFAVLPVSVLALVLGLLIVSWRRQRVGALFYGLLSLGIVVSCLVPRVKVGGALNNLIPVHAWLAILGGVAAGHLLNAGQAGTSWLRGWIGPAIAVGLALQLVWLRYDPAIVLPSARDRAAGERVVERLRRVEGEVLVPAQGYLAGMAGKRVFAHQMPVDDLSRSGLPGAEALRGEFRQAIDEQRFEIIIDSTSHFLRHYPDDRVLQARYRVLGPVLQQHDLLKPLSGWRVGLGEVWVPRESAAAVGPRASLFQRLFIE